MPLSVERRRAIAARLHAKRGNTVSRMLSILQIFADVDAAMRAEHADYRAHADFQPMRDAGNAARDLLHEIGAL